MVQKEWINILWTNCATSFPNIDFRQTYGTSELGVVRVKSKSKKQSFHQKLATLD